MSDTPNAAPGGAARSATSKVQVLALILLGGGAYALVGAIIWIVVMCSPSEPVRLMLAGYAGSLLTIPLTIVGFYFGASIKQGQQP